MTSNSKRRIDIDLLRTIAILSVVFCHTFEIPFAAVGVQIFFVVSGFLLSNFSASYSKFDFLMHRMFRLFPLAFAMCLVFYFRFSDFRWFILNVFLLHSLFPSNESFPGGWSISYEWLFSVILATGILNVTIFVKLLGLVSIVCILLISAYDLDLIKLSFIGTDLYLIILFCANLYFFILGLVLSRIRIRRIKVKYSICVLIFSILIGLGIENLKYISWTILVTTLSILVINNTSFVRVLESDFIKLILTFIGKYTYGIFCGHFIIIISLSNLSINNREVKVFLQNNLGVVGDLLYFFTVLGFSILFGSLSYRYFEKPALRLPNQLKKIFNNDRN